MLNRQKINWSFWPLDNVAPNTEDVLLRRCITALDVPPDISADHHDSNSMDIPSILLCNFYCRCELLREGIDIRRYTNTTNYATLVPRHFTLRAIQLTCTRWTARDPTICVTDIDVSVMWVVAIRLKYYCRGKPWVICGWLPSWCFGCHGRKW